jgi:hypothetical protein
MQSDKAPVMRSKALNGVEISRGTACAPWSAQNAVRVIERPCT